MTHFVGRVYVRTLYLRTWPFPLPTTKVCRGFVESQFMSLVMSLTPKAYQFSLELCRQADWKQGKMHKITATSQQRPPGRWTLASCRLNNKFQYCLGGAWYLCRTNHFWLFLLLHFSSYHLRSGTLDHENSQPASELYEGGEYRKKKRTKNGRNW